MLNTSSAAVTGELAIQTADAAEEEDILGEDELLVQDHYPEEFGHLGQSRSSNLATRKKIFINQKVCV